MTDGQLSNPFVLSAEVARTDLWSLGSRLATVVAMDPARRKRTIKAAEVRRAELLDAAAKLFRLRGFDGVSVADITGAAQVAKGTFYLYFESREALLDALRERFSETMAGELQGLRPPREPAGWPSFLRRLVKRAIELQVEQRESHELLRRLPHGGSDDGHHADPVRGHLAGIVEAGILAGAIRVGEPDLAVDLLYELLHAAGDRAAAHPTAAPKVIRAAQEFTIRALGVNL